MTATVQHAVPDADVRREPVVPWDPGRGWAEADLLRRGCAVAALPLALLLLLLVVHGGQPAVVAMWAWLVVGPTTFYALARVLRPEPRSWERTSRHVLAGAGTAFGLPVAGAIVAGAMLAGLLSVDVEGQVGALVILFGSAAFVLGVVTVVWGLIAWAVRERRY